MSIPRPEEIARKQRSIHNAEIERVTKAIVMCLETSSEWPALVHESVTDVVRPHIVLQFAEAGWRITFHSEQRNGSWIEVSPA